MASKLYHKLLVLALCLQCASASLAETVSPQRQEELVYLLRQDCGSCHGMTLKGGLGPSLLPDALEGKPDEYLRQVIAKGVPETAMPPWENILRPEEINFLLEYLTRPADTPELNP